MKLQTAVLLSILIILTPHSRGLSDGIPFFIDTETGAVFTGYNDVAIPGDNGTRFSLSDDLNADTDKTRFDKTQKR